MSAPSASEAASSEPAPPPRVARAVPADVDVTKLQQALRCGPKPKGACGVLEAFAQAGRFVLDAPSGEGRWFGRAYVVQKKTEKFEYVTVLGKKLPTARVGPGELPVSIGMDPIPERLIPFADELWGGLERSNGRRAKRKNPAFGYLHEYAPKAARGTLPTQGTSVETIGEIGEDTSYLRQESLKKVLLVRPASAGDAAPGDGLYATLWMAVW